MHLCLYRSMQRKSFTTYLHNICHTLSNNLCSKSGPASVSQDDCYWATTTDMYTAYKYKCKLQCLVASANCSAEMDGRQNLHTETGKYI